MKRLLKDWISIVQAAAVVLGMGATVLLYIVRAEMADTKADLRQVKHDVQEIKQWIRPARAVPDNITVARKGVSRE